MHVHPFSRAWRYANRFLTTKWLRSLHLKFTGGCFFHIHSVSVRVKYIIVVAFCHGFDPPVMFYSVNPWSWHYIISKVSTSKTMWCVGEGNYPKMTLFQVVSSEWFDQTTYTIRTCPAMTYPNLMPPDKPWLQVCFLDPTGGTLCDSAGKLLQVPWLQLWSGRSTGNDECLLVVTICIIEYGYPLHFGGCNRHLLH